MSNDQFLMHLLFRPICQVSYNPKHRHSFVTDVVNNKRPQGSEVNGSTMPFILTLQIVHNSYKSEIVDHLRGNETPNKQKLSL